MADFRALATSQSTLRAAIVIVVSIFAIIVFNGTRSRSDTSTTDSSMSSCDELRLSEVGRSRTLLGASLSGVITATASELKEVQAVLRVKRIERISKEAELETRSAEQTVEEAERKFDQRELAERDTEVKENQSELNAKTDELRAAEAANDDQDHIDTLTEDLADLEVRSAFLDNRMTTLNERIARRSASIGSLTQAVAALDAEIATLDAEIASLTVRETALEATIEAKYLARSAMLTTDDRTIEVQQVRSEINTKNEELLAAQKMEDEQPLVGELIDDIRLLELMVASLTDPIRSFVAESEDDISSAYHPPRSDVNLVPEVPVSRINLGSHRAPNTVEIVLASASLGVAMDSSTEANADSAAVARQVELPDKAEFFVEAGRFRRSEGIEIPAEDISAWARRVGNTVFMSVCIEPAGLDPGLYAGDVYLVDPSLNSTKVHVEVTAQSELINLLYLLLLILPVLALAYVWITARYSAGQDPWDSRHWWTWFRQNFVAVLVVGFAAVWATLQVPFNNPTWGASWLTSAAVIGVGLVAAVTAMTVVAGRVVGERQSNDPPNNGTASVAGETGETTSDES